MTYQAKTPLFAAPHVHVETRQDGTQILSSPIAPIKTAHLLGEWLVRWAKEATQRPFLCERPGGDPAKPWRIVSYGEALAKVEAFATGLLRCGLSAERPLAILCDNSVDHALLVLAAMHVGIPASSISPAYSLVSRDFAKLKSIMASLKPGGIFIPETEPYAKALAAIEGLHDGVVIMGHGTVPKGAILLDSLGAETDQPRIAALFASLDETSIAKILFTSGSTGEPKGVINTHRMLCSSQDAKALLWPFVQSEPPVILDWLPWSHTFGANHNFNLILRNGGTLYIDGGKPAPGIFNRTLANIRDVSGTIYFNVPRGFDMLVSELRKDDALREAFFRNLKVIFYAGAALPQNLWADLEEIAIQTLGHPVAMVSAWGSTETSPLATDCHFQAERSGVIGLPIPGCELKLVPNGSKTEIRVRGSNVTPGYWKRDDLTAKAFDSEGFYCIGDAVRFVDASDPAKGLLFDGRVAEDFKLMSGTWVNVGNIRLKGIQHLAPVAQDIVVTGHDREGIGFLVFANVPACRQLAGLGDDIGVKEVLECPALVAHVRAGLAALKAEGGGSASYATRAVLMAEPASIDDGEITDKGYVNQRAVLTRRSGLVDDLYHGGENVIFII